MEHPPDILIAVYFSEIGIELHIVDAKTQDILSIHARDYTDNIPLDRQKRLFSHVIGRMVGDITKNIEEGHREANRRLLADKGDA